jgi:hypothetical protein
MGITTMTGGSGAEMRFTRLVILLALLGIGASSLSACVVEHRRDGGLTSAPTALTV